MAQAKAGDTVLIEYTGKLKDGTIVVSSEPDKPFEFTIGEGQVISGLDKAVVGMKPGESRTVEIPAEEAFGPPREGDTVEIDREMVSSLKEPKLQAGDQLRVHQEGRSYIVRVVDVSEATITVDSDHPLAGEVLVFEVRLVDIV
jgi:peptidylprolyl isomerase